MKMHVSGTVQHTLFCPQAIALSTIASREAVNAPRSSSSIFRGSSRLMLKSSSFLARLENSDSPGPFKFACSWSLQLTCEEK